MREVLILVGLALAQVATSSPKRYSVEELETRNATDLARDVFGDAGASFVERRTSRINGVGEWIGVSADFASLPRPSGADGLCIYDSGSAYFAWHHRRVPGDPDYLELETKSRARQFALLSGSPSLKAGAGDVAACAGLSPILGRSTLHDLQIMAGDVPANLSQAVFALRALGIAKRNFAHVSCGAGYATCDKISTVREFDLTRAYSVVLGPCDQGGQQCVDARIESSGGAILLRARVNASQPNWRDARPRVRAVELSIETWPIS